VLSVIALCSVQLEALRAEQADWAQDIAVAAVRQLESEMESSVPAFQDSGVPALGFSAARSVAALVPFAAAEPEAVAAEHFAAARNCVAAEKVADLEVVGNCAAVPGRCVLVPGYLAGFDFGRAHPNAFGPLQALAFA
jgi:hypothetical protein